MSVSGPLLIGGGPSGGGGGGSSDPAATQTANWRGEGEETLAQATQRLALPTALKVSASALALDNSMATAWLTSNSRYVDLLDLPAGPYTLDIPEALLPATAGETRSAFLLLPTGVTLDVVSGTVLTTPTAPTVGIAQAAVGRDGSSTTPVNVSAAGAGLAIAGTNRLLIGSFFFYPTVSGPLDLADVTIALTSSTGGFSPGAASITVDRANPAYAAPASQPHTGDAHRLTFSAPLGDAGSAQQLTVTVTTAAGVNSAGEALQVAVVSNRDPARAPAGSTHTTSGITDDAGARPTAQPAYQAVGDVGVFFGGYRLGASTATWTDPPVTAPTGGAVLGTAVSLVPADSSSNFFDFALLTAAVQLSADMDPIVWTLAGSQAGTRGYEAAVVAPERVTGAVTILGNLPVETTGPQMLGIELQPNRVIVL